MSETVTLTRLEVARNDDDKMPNYALGGLPAGDGSEWVSEANILNLNGVAWATSSAEFGEYQRTITVEVTDGGTANITITEDN